MLLCLAHFYRVTVAFSSYSCHGLPLPVLLVFFFFFYFLTDTPLRKKRPLAPCPRQGSVLHACGFLDCYSSVVQAGCPDTPTIKRSGILCHERQSIHSCPVLLSFNNSPDTFRASRLLLLWFRRQDPSRAEASEHRGIGDLKGVKDSPAYLITARNGATRHSHITYSYRPLRPPIRDHSGAILLLPSWTAGRRRLNPNININRVPGQLLLPVPEPLRRILHLT